MLSLPLQFMPKKILGPISDQNHLRVYYSTGFQDVVVPRPRLSHYVVGSILLDNAQHEAYLFNNSLFTDLRTSTRTIRLPRASALRRKKGHMICFCALAIEAQETGLSSCGLSSLLPPDGRAKSHKRRTGNEHHYNP